MSTEAGTIEPSCQQGATDRSTRSRPTQSPGRARISSISRVRERASSRAGTNRFIPRRGTTGSSTQSSRVWSTRSRLDGIPHHRECGAARSKSSPRSRRDTAGRNSAKPGDSTSPLPIALARTARPCRTACTRPGVPSSAVPSSSSGSQRRSGTRRRSTSSGTSPPSVLRASRSSRTVRSPPSTSGKPR